jgi:hypothetical protein
MLKRVLILLLAGLLALSMAAGIVLGALALNWLTPPSGLVQLGPVRVQAISPCQLDQPVHVPCLLPDSAAGWFVRLELHNRSGRQQRWTLYGGGPEPLRVDRS